MTQSSYIKNTKRYTVNSVYMLGTNTKGDERCIDADLHKVVTSLAAKAKQQSGQNK